MNNNNNQKKVKLSEREILLIEKKHWERELENANTVIKCQTEKNKIQEKLDELEDKLLVASVDIIKDNDNIEREREQK